jgi:hypothetical protein
MLFIVGGLLKDSETMAGVIVHILAGLSEALDSLRAVGNGVTDMIKLVLETTRRGVIIICTLYGE